VPAHQANSRHKRTKVLMLSARDRRPTRALQDAGADDYPDQSQPRELLQVVTRSI
jgi:DNA-binding response OmpR family regulator